MTGIKNTAYHSKVLTLFPHTWLDLYSARFLLHPSTVTWCEKRVGISLYHQTLSFHAGFFQNGARYTGELPADHPFQSHRSIEACIDITFIKCGVIQFMNRLNYLCEPGTSINRSICLDDLFCL